MTSRQTSFDCCWCPVALCICVQDVGPDHVLMLNKFNTMNQHVSIPSPLSLIRPSLVCTLGERPPVRLGSSVSHVHIHADTGWVYVYSP